MSSFIIKIIAMLSMFCDHLSRVIFTNGETTFLNYIGRFAFILFCFQLVLGYKKTRSLKKYLGRLLLLGIVSQIPYTLLFSKLIDTKNLNVCFTLFLGLISISILNFHKDKDNKIRFRDNKYNLFEFKSIKSVVTFIIKCLLIIGICLLINNSENLIGYAIEYNYEAILFMIFIYLFYPFENKYSIPKIVMYIISILLFAFIEAEVWLGFNDLSLPVFYTTKAMIKYFSIYIFCIIGGLIPLLYNGKEGKPLKTINYLFYPVHLIILYLLSLVI